MKHTRHFLVGLMVLMSVLIDGAQAQPKITRTDLSIGIEFDQGVHLEFALANGWLLGLRNARVDGVALKSDSTVIRPYLIQEWVQQPTAWKLGLVEVKIEGDHAVIVCNLVAEDGAMTGRRLFRYRDDGQGVYDPYEFIHTQVPSDVVRVSELEKQAGLDHLNRASAGAGTLRWVIEPLVVNIAGWEWRGWKHHYEFALAEGKKINCLRELGTWELGGQACGNTLVNMRYRGLGGIVSTLAAASTTQPAAGGVVPVVNAFSTSEIFGKPIKFSNWPSINVGEESTATRSDCMKHRDASWEAQPQRGAGVAWVDFQYQAGAALAGWYERMEAIRSCTEIWPGDAQISQTDALYFPLTDRQSTVPKLHLALVPRSGVMPDYEWHTRWQEMEQYARDMIGRELGYVQTQPLPTTGVQFDTRWADCYTAMQANMDRLDAAGVRRIIIHQPGWFNGRGLRQKETPYPIPLDSKGKPDTGGACEIYDYVPQSQAVADGWAATARELDRRGIECWVWVTGMVRDNGPVAREIGLEHFCRNRPGAATSTGYPPRNFTLSMRDPRIQAWFEERMNKMFSELGVRGIWADSFHNLYMSQMNYQSPDWAPQVRQWWEWIASVSRRNVGWMSEAVGFPGLSCSIEVNGSPEDFEGIWWTMPYVTRWYRYEFPHAGTAAADRLCFRAMANKGGVACGDGTPTTIPTFDKVTKIIPDFKRFSDEYMAALPSMKRPYQLPENQGVLWLGEDSDDAGVWFAFSDGPLPQGVTAGNIIGGDPVTAVVAHHTYRISGRNLVKAFGLLQGGLTDDRKKTGSTDQEKKQ